MKIKQKTKRIYYLISVAIVVVVVVFGFVNENKDKRTWIECDVFDMVLGNIYAFDEKYFYTGYVSNTGEFLFRKFVKKFNKIEATYTGVINEEYNEASVYIDRVKGTVRFYTTEALRDVPKHECTKIKKPKIEDIPTKL
jgi:hypothetical protein